MLSDCATKSTRSWCAAWTITAARLSSGSPTSGAQGTVCGGGRYDGLVSQFGGKPTPGVGFAMGVERLVLLETGVIPPN